MASTAEDFKRRFPEFNDEEEYPSCRIAIFLDDAVTQYMGSDEDRWGDKYDYAHAYLAAHLLYLSSLAEYGDGSAQAGSISSVTAGGVSVARAVSTKERSDTDEFYMSSSYGQRFLMTRDSCFVGVLTV